MNPLRFAYVKQHGVLVQVETDFVKVIYHRPPQLSVLT